MSSPVFSLLGSINERNSFETYPYIEVLNVSSSLRSTIRELKREVSTAMSK
jgi:hypothetical protein